MTPQDRLKEIKNLPILDVHINHVQWLIDRVQQLEASVEGMLNNTDNTYIFKVATEALTTDPMERK